MGRILVFKKRSDTWTYGRLGRLGTWDSLRRMTYGGSRECEKGTQGEDEDEVGEYAVEGEYPFMPLPLTYAELIPFDEYCCPTVVECPMLIVGGDGESR